MFHSDDAKVIQKTVFVHRRYNHLTQTTFVFTLLKTANIFVDMWLMMEVNGLFPVGDFAELQSDEGSEQMRTNTDAFLGPKSRTGCHRFTAVLKEDYEDQQGTPNDRI